MVLLGSAFVRRSKNRKLRRDIGWEARSSASSDLRRVALAAGRRDRRQRCRWIQESGSQSFAEKTTDQPIGSCPVEHGMEPLKIACGGAEIEAFILLIPARQGGSAEIPSQAEDMGASLGADAICAPQINVEQRTQRWITELRGRGRGQQVVRADLAPPCVRGS